jgi:hypothetical protein
MVLFMQKSYNSFIITNGIDIRGVMTEQTPEQGTQQPIQPQYEVPSQEPEDDFNPNACVGCGSKIVEHGHLTPMCAACRDKYSKFPIPVFVKVLLVLFIALAAAAFMKFPESLSAGVAFERGQRAEKAGNFQEAIKEYKIAKKKFEYSTMITGRIGISMYKDGDFSQAITVLNTLVGKEVNKELVKEVNSAFDDMEAKYKEMEKLEKAAMEKGKKTKKVKK